MFATAVNNLCMLNIWNAHINGGFIHTFYLQTEALPKGKILAPFEICKHSVYAYTT